MNPPPLSPPRQKLLRIVKRRKTITVDEACEELGLSKNATRAHILHLEREEVLSRVTTPQNSPKRGRPQATFTLGVAAQRFLPSHETNLLVDLVQFLQDHEQHTLLEAYFQDLWTRKYEELEHHTKRPLHELPFDERLRALEKFLEDNAFMPSISTDSTETGSVTVYEHHCPFFNIVQHTRLPCRLETEFLSRVLQRDLDRATFAKTPACSCSFTFHPPSEE